MFKKISLSLLIAIPFSLHAKVHYPPNVKQSDVVQATDEGKVIMAWDIHKVLAAKDKQAGGIVSVLWSAKSEFGSVIKDLAWTKLTGRPTRGSLVKKDLDALAAAIKAMGVNDPSGEPYVLIFEKHGLIAIAKAIENATSNYIPQPGMQAIVDEIANNNIEQRFASNIGPRMLVVLKNKFKNTFNSTLLERILPGKVVDYSQFGSAPLDKANLPSELAPTGKPTAAFYRGFLNTYVTDTTGKKFAVFVDDSEENVKGAAKEGMIAIHFDATKPNAQAMAELRADLTELSILK
ncbi:hypothetical protein BH09DEP1_BH09DEP1_5330 [soil metagenome]